MRVSLCLDRMDVRGGGPARSVPNLAKSLSEIGVEVTLLTIKSEDNNLHLLEGSKVNVIEIENPKEEILNIFKNGFDVVHTQGVWVPFYHYVTKYAKNLNIPIIATPRGCLEPHCMNTKKFKKKIAMMLYQRKDLENADCLLATAKMEADNFRNLGLKNDIAVIPNGLNVNEYPLRNNLHPHRQVLFISRIDPKKGIPILIKAWKNIVNDFENWNLLIVGNGEKEYIDEINRLITNEGIQDSVSVLPPAFGKEKINLLNESALFVLPTYSENFGMAIAEAMSCGLPVITTTGTPWREIKENGAGWWIDLSIDNLTKALIEAMSMSDEERMRIGIQGNRIIAENYRADIVATKMEELYQWIVNKKSHTTPAFIHRI